MEINTYWQSGPLPKGIITSKIYRERELFNKAYLREPDTKLEAE